MNMDDSPLSTVNKLTQLRKAKSNLAPVTTTSSAPVPKELIKTNSLKTDLKSVNKSPSFIKDLNEAKARNHKAGSMSDTASFTESLLESSAFVPNKEAQPDGIRGFTISPFQMSTPYSAAKTISDDGTYRISTGKKPLLDTYRVSTATKMSEEQLELPPVPTIKEPPKCQKQILLDVAPVKPNRKRRSSSATRQELQEAERMRQETEVYQKRSRSPSNFAELKAVSSHQVEYQQTPRSTVPSQRGVAQPSNKSFLSPEPRSRETHIYGGGLRSPFTSPKSVASSMQSDPVEPVVFNEFYKSPVRETGRAPGSVRSASQCSVVSSETSHRETLPLKATHSEISWGSTKLRKSEKKSIQIKNASNKKLTVKASITGPGFQLCGTDDLLTLQSQECRSIVVDFCPTVIGAAVGLLSFCSPHDSYAQRVVSLYGYGGESSVRVEGIQKGPSGPYLELGQARNLGRPLEKTFSLYNKGSLPAFARIGIDKKGLDQTFLASAVYVQPQVVIIPPNSYSHIKVIFKPRRQEVSKILQKQVDVLSITNLHILWGDEPTRHRIRKLVALVRKNDLKDPEKFTPMASICQPIPNEKEFNELESFSENVFDTIHELFLTFREYELVLTIDRALDDTMLDLTLSEDTSALFKTMCASSDAGSPRLPDEISPSMSALQSAKRDSGESWSVRPTYLEFRGDERTKQFVIKSNFYTSQFFELNSNFRPLFKFSPMEGQIRPGQEVVINVNYQSGPPVQQAIFIVVYIENEKITIPVYVRRNRPGVGTYS
ncbi:uncharacterized protein LOC129757690 [Uranotaenia lowii]|uniref:uncharacterized protein LOC129757690 n=1 Tax=Uranotaenia lowii TaxID=190385 RepID=UPI00247984A0|nr:uncharacterized protein LOC129757690 [Uranotaenia lowii]